METVVLVVVVDARTYQQLDAAAVERHGLHPGDAERERRIEALADAAISEAALGWWNSKGQPELPALPANAGRH